MSSWTGLADNKSTVQQHIMVLQCCPANLSSVWSLLFTFPSGLWFSPVAADFIRILYLFLSPHPPHQYDFPPSSPKWCTQLEMSHRFAGHTTISHQYLDISFSFTSSISEFCHYPFCFLHFIYVPFHWLVFLSKLSLMFSLPFWKRSTFDCAFPCCDSSLHLFPL